MNPESETGSASAVRTERLGPVTCITLSRPEVRSAVGSDAAEALHAAFLAFEDDAQARVAVLHGAHGHFCAGWICSLVPAWRKVGRLRRSCNTTLMPRHPMPTGLLGP